MKETTMRIPTSPALLLAAVTMIVALTATTITAQPRYDYNNMVRERLGRGVVAVKSADGQVAVSWRLLEGDRNDEPFDVYRNGVKISREPLTGATFFTDRLPLAGDAVYEVRGGNCDGRFTLRADAPAGYLPIALDKPDGGQTPDGWQYTYSANDATVADVDGDGQYEIILKWDPSNAADNAHAGFTGPTLIDCYKLFSEDIVNSQTENSQIVNNQLVNSKLLWRINLGPNIRSGAHYTQFVVYDFDGDGCAELMVRTADGTRDGLGHVIGNERADWRFGLDQAAHMRQVSSLRTRQDHAEDNRAMKHWDAERDRQRRPDRQQPHRRGKQYGGGDNRTGRILEGPEYLSVFNGKTGAVMATTNYVPLRGDVSEWGDNHANRSDRFLAAVAYLGATASQPSPLNPNPLKASAIFCRGYYTRTVIAAWDWDGRELKNRWTFDTNQPEWRSYAGQGNHNLRVADVDGDGYDEITYGSMAVDHDGRGLYNTGFGHGDAIHLIAHPETGELYIWDCHENRRDGSELRHAATGKVVFQIKSQMDVGRCMAADIDPNSPGWEMWSSDSKGIRTMTGELLRVQDRTTGDHPLVTATGIDGKDRSQDNTAVFLGTARLSTNFGIWWDGDLLRELLDRETVTKYDWTTGGVNVVQRLEGCQFNNGTKSTPCLQADLLGDWREEVLARNPQSTELRLYVTTIPTDHRLPCLMLDIPYRLSVAYQNTGYNQPPEPGFFLGAKRP